MWCSGAIALYLTGRTIACLQGSRRVPFVIDTQSRQISLLVTVKSLCVATIGFVEQFGNKRHPLCARGDSVRLVTAITTEKSAQQQSFYSDVVYLAVMRGLWLLIPAWTLGFTAAWLFLAVTLTGDLLTRRYLVHHDRALLERRRNQKYTSEKRARQRFAFLWLQLLFLGCLAWVGFDHRYDWSSVPTAVSAIGFGCVLAGLWVTFLAVRANTFASATVTLHEGHQVISTGAYGWVRHPMYSGMLLLIVGIPLALGSWWALIATALYALVLHGRMVDEEKLLMESLPGYREYSARVRSRVIPSVW